MDIVGIIVELLFWRGHFRFRKRKKERRRYEEENNLPKKLMIHPVLKFLAILIALSFLYAIILKPIVSSRNGITETTNKMVTIKRILEKEKQKTGFYPIELCTIIRNKPSRKNITTDYWGSQFHYVQKENGLDYILISKGYDKTLNSEDDLR